MTIVLKKNKYFFEMSLIIINIAQLKHSSFSVFRKFNSSKNNQKKYSNKSNK